MKFNIKERLVDAKNNVFSDAHKEAVHDYVHDVLMPVSKEVVTKMVVTFIVVSIYKTATTQYPDRLPAFMTNKIVKESLDEAIKAS